MRQWICSRLVAIIIYGGSIGIDCSGIDTAYSSRDQEFTCILEGEVRHEAELCSQWFIKAG